MDERGHNDHFKDINIMIKLIKTLIVRIMLRMAQGKEEEEEHRNKSKKDNM